MCVCDMLLFFKGKRRTDEMIIAKVGESLIRRWFLERVKI